MKRILSILSIAVTAILALSCYDDTALWDTVNDHEDRITELETLCKKMNSDISSLQSLLEAVEEGDYIVDIKPLVENGVEVGYTVTFARNGSINIYHGKNGKDGADGEDGKDGANGADGAPGTPGADGQTPVIGVKIDEDGRYYWTLNGEWLLDENGNKVPATGKDGEDGKDGADGSNGAPGTDGAPGIPGADGTDGITPQLKIEENVWFISYDNGITWIKLGVTVSTSNSESIFSKVEYDENHIYFTLADGTVITASRGSSFDLTFAGGEEFAYSKGEEFEVGYKITGATPQTTVTAFGPYGWKVRVIKTDDQSGHIRVISTDDAEDGDVAVIASNGNQNTVVRTLSFSEGAMKVHNNAYQVSHEACELEIALSTNLEYEAVIDTDWMTLATETKSLEMRDEVIRLQVSVNTTGYMRSGYVYIMNSGGIVIETISVVQLPDETDVPEEPALKASEWGLVGDFNAWSAPDSTMYEFSENLFVVYDMIIPEDGSFKIRANEEWNDAANYGLAVTGVVEVDHAYDLVCGGGSGNIQIAAGTYDIWFDLAQSTVYIMTPGKDISEIVTPEEPETYTVAGTIDGANWDPASEVGLMTLEGDCYVARNVPFIWASTAYSGEDQFEFKICENKNWTVSYGAGAEEVASANTEIAVVLNGYQNIVVAGAAEGAYDVYFDKTNCKVWVMSPGLKPGETPEQEPEVPEGPVVANIADFLAAAEDETVYQLTGLITSVTNTTYGNFYIEDETGEVYIYGLCSPEGESKYWAASGAAAGDTITVQTVRSSYNGTPQGKNAIFVSLVKGEPAPEPEIPEVGDNGLATNVVCTPVSSAYIDGVATVNGVADVFTLKFGTSKKFGEATITLPAGTTEVTYYAVGWKGAPSKLEFSVDGIVMGTQEIAANDGATSNSPYTMTVTENDHYTFTLPAALEADTDVTVMTIEKGYRALLFGIQAK